MTRRRSREAEADVLAFSTLSLISLPKSGVQFVAHRDHLSSAPSLSTVILTSPHLYRPLDLCSLITRELEAQHTSPTMAPHRSRRKPVLPSSTPTSASPKNVVRNVKSHVPSSVWVVSVSKSHQLARLLSSLKPFALVVVSAPKSAPSKPSTSSSSPPTSRTKPPTDTAPTRSSCIVCQRHVQVRSSVSSVPTVSQVDGTQDLGW